MKILLIEDDKNMADFIRLSYKDERFFVFGCISDALKWLETNRADLAIIDLGLPDSYGIDTLKHLEHINMPKIVMTGSVNMSIKEVAKYGADDFLPKGGDIHYLLERISFNIEKNRPKKRCSFEPHVFEQIKAHLTAPRELTAAW